MTSSDPLPAVEPGQGPTTPLVIATLHRPEGVTGVQTHVSELLAHLERHGRAATLVTPFSWGGPLTVPVFGLRLVLSRVSSAAGVMWHRHWHEAFLRQALRRQLGRLDDCVIYAQGPAAARAALRARRGPQQVVVMAIHFRVSQADEYVESGQIARDGRAFRRLRQVEREVIPQLDGVVAVTRWARDALLAWLPEADTVPYAVISNFVHRQPAAVAAPLADLVTIGRLEPVKNHGFLLEVLAEANRRGRRHTLDVYGEGDSRVSLEQQAKTLGVEQQVRFRGFRSDVRTLLPRYRAYIHAAYSESSSLAIMESMAAGLPILAGDLAPLRELCDDGVEARFFPLADPARAAVAMIETLDREPMRAEMSRAARDRFDRDFEAEVLAPELLSFLESRVPSISRSRS
ncbi:glycosyltransferase family 4 protein [Knoellia sp. CPCC 206450]|uniref:glycosyltransferase family 4 protein n=1 Tax=Knoellia tibetensis TaxID=3404798 RepID=UPI003B42EA79